MARIRNVGSIKVITFDENIDAQRPGFCGVVSNISWRNADVRKGLRTMFACKDDEEIVAIEITDEGIKAKFERT